MTTFKNNAKYAELIMTYLDVAVMDNNPLSVSDILSIFKWKFKGGSMKKVALSTELSPEVSCTTFPDGTTEDILAEWPDGPNALALRRILLNRRAMWKPKMRAVAARIATYQVLVSSGAFGERCETLYTGMKSIYHLFGLLWDQSPKLRPDKNWELLHRYTRELLVSTGSVSRTHLETVEANRKKYQSLLESSRLSGLLLCIRGVKELIFAMGAALARNQARRQGAEEKEFWEDWPEQDLKTTIRVRDRGEETQYQIVTVGHLNLRVTQNAAVYGTSVTRYALGKSDVERLHQVLMSAASAIVGVCAQAVTGTEFQRRKASRAIEITEKNITRLVISSRKVGLGDEVLVCKGYRRAYTAVLGRLAGPLCVTETQGLIEEARSTASEGILDIDGFIDDCMSLDAANALNSAKVFKICPAPDVSPGGAMLDRIKQIGNGNSVSQAIMPEFEEELKTQILRAFIRCPGKKLKVREGIERPQWYGQYLAGELDAVPSAEISTTLAWEGTAILPDISPHDPSNWKDSGIGADTIAETTRFDRPRHMSNMMTRLLFDDNCPMPGHTEFTDENVIKFFVKAEGHKDPARGIFSANLADRQVQSWMEKCVENVASHHPSFMIGQPSEVKDAKVLQLTERPAGSNWLALYYSFDISGWSAKMPAEPQRISHKIWADLYDSVMFRQATRMNEGAHIYLDIDGYRGWFKNTHANLEGFNGKEMTMVLVALLSLAVKRWRIRVVEEGVLHHKEAMSCVALLFAYIDDGLSRIDLPKDKALGAFEIYKEVVIDTFAKCGFSVEVTKCFPSDRFSIFLNEVYMAGRHVVHGVRAAMAISSEPTERHNTLIERVSSVATGCRGATMAGLAPQSAVMLMAYHCLMHLLEWVEERDPVVLSAWSVTPRTWGGLGLPNMLQLFTSGSGAAFEEGVATLQAYARVNVGAKKAFISLVNAGLATRGAVSVLTSPLSGQVEEGMMIDSRVSSMVRRALQEKTAGGKVSSYAERLLRYADVDAFTMYAEAIVPMGEKETLQEQMLVDMAEAHPHNVFSAFARRLEKSMTVLQIIGRRNFVNLIRVNRVEAETSVLVFRSRMSY
jgi:hypothetical protein